MDRLGFTNAKPAARPNPGLFPPADSASAHSIAASPMLSTIGHDMWNWQTRTTSREY